MSEKQTRPFNLFSDPSLDVDPQGLRATANVGLVFAFAALFGSLFVAGCGGGTQGSNTPPVAYTVGGTVSGLAGSGFVLQDNGGNNLAVSSNGTFTFTAALASGTAYKVTVLSQPTNPNQTCTVSAGTGTLTSNVTNVLVTCTTDTYTIGGTVINLVGTGGGLQLQDNGGDTLLVNANGSFTFPTALLSGTAYTITVFVQPSSPAQTCGVTNGTGIATANVSGITVDCGHNEWTWMGGSNLIQQKGTYGTEGTAAPSNIPGGRIAGGGVIAGTGANVAVWLFGGQGLDSAGTQGLLNDLWKYSAGEWTWTTGSNLVGQKGTYGTQGTAAASNVPGARLYPTTWTDANGNFWLFGGQGLDSTGTSAFLNDLWEYSAGQWTWIGGSNVGDQKGTYGTQGTAAPSNIPGARTEAIHWTDAAGNIWLFGGIGTDSTGTNGDLNDLWKYSAGEWTWMDGSNVVNQKGTYGTQGIAGASNTPGARYDAITWTDAAGNLWLFGGFGYDSAGTTGDLNDLWKYGGGQWTWMGGSNVVNQKGIYGTQGTAAASNVPGAREGGMHWTDTSGNFWLFGGTGYDSAGTGGGVLNDLWKYSGGQWTWIGGSNLANRKGTYGTQGMNAPSNIPGGRWSGVAWTDAAGNFWLFGGGGIDSTGAPGGGNLNDLWRYEP
jgi:N-acetylneuraminic acid mutarotase